MTMAHERTRSLRWAFEVLKEVSDAAWVSEIERDRAATLLINYPTPATVLAWIESDAYCIPIDAAIAIESTGDLLRRISRSEACSAQLRHGVSFALRHFPDPGSAECWVKSSAGWTIKTWLLQENQYDQR